MPKLTISISTRGQGAYQPEDGGPAQKSFDGHMWYSVDLGDGSGNKSYGFAQEIGHEGKPIAPGNVHKTDNKTYRQRVYTKSIEINPDEADKLLKFGEDAKSYGFDTSHYNAMNNSCVDFTWKALESAGITKGGFEGMPSPSRNVPYLEKALEHRESVDQPQTATTPAQDRQVQGLGVNTSDAGAAARSPARELTWLQRAARTIYPDHFTAEELAQAGIPGSGSADGMSEALLHKTMGTFGNKDDQTKARRGFSG